MENLIYKNRFSEKEKIQSEKIWEVLVENYFQNIIPQNSTILDIGMGEGYFLKHIKCSQKFGIDSNPETIKKHEDGIKIYIAKVPPLLMFNSNYFDFIFISNFLKHLNSPDKVLYLLKESHRVLKKNGKIIILQPNFALLGSDYFKFIDHKVILTHHNLKEALEISGFNIKKMIIRFLPYTTKSILPKHPLFVKLYLKTKIIWYFLGKQTLFIGEKL
ncbi:MAG: class I SAM-dependent methyltransferase [Elusimicrobiales bacterium]|nr:class I SAM-dependent methyltransferase [Elusimicrobiales bacterium]